MTEIGSSAGGGIARQYSMCGIANRRDQADRPSGMPSTIPSDDADREAEQDPLEARHDMRAELREEPEILELGEDRRRRREVPGCPPDAAHSCQAATIATGTAISATILSGL